MKGGVYRMLTDMSLYGGAETSCGIVRRTAVNAPPLSV